MSTGAFYAANGTMHHFNQPALSLDASPSAESILPRTADWELRVQEELAQRQRASELFRAAYLRTDDDTAVDD
jgi:hypothetical protein